MATPLATPGDSAAHGSDAPRRRRYRVHHLARAKESGERITMLTAYDAVTAAVFDAAGIDVLLVGDSIGNTMHGHATTLPVTVDDMIPAARAVAGAAAHALVVVDLPFGSYEAGPEQALGTAVRIMKETGAAAVKLEGGRRSAAQLDALMAGKTVIAIAHRLSTIAAMDRLVVLDKGVIVEQGAHAELLQLDGHYARLWHRQSGGFLDTATLQ